MKPTISIVLITLGLTFPAPALADEQSIMDRIEAQRIQQADHEYRAELARYEAHRKRWRVFHCPARKASNGLDISLISGCKTQEYDWMGWKREGTIYTTMRQRETHPPSPKVGLSWPPLLSDPEKISVDCRALQVKEYLSEYEIERNRLALQAQSDPVIRGRLKQLHDAFIPDWRLPEKGSETAMVAARCASAL